MDKKLSWNKLKLFLMKITTWTIQTPRTIPKLVTQHNIARWKQTLSVKSGFPQNPIACTFFIKVLKKNFFVKHYFSNPSIWKPTAQAFQNTITFAQYLFNSRSNMHVNLVHWNSLHSKNAILPTFSGLTPDFLGKNHKTRTYNLYHRNAWFVAVILSLRVGVQHKLKRGEIMLSTQWQ